MLRIVARASAAFALFIASAIAGLLFASHVVPHQLRALVERELSAALRSPVEIESVRIRLGRGLILRGENVTTWLDTPRRTDSSEFIEGSVEASADAPDTLSLDPGDPLRSLRAPGLYAGRVDASLDLVSLLTGRFRISRIVLVDTVLEVTRGTEGAIRPGPIATLLASRDRGLGAQPLSEAEELLLPLSGIKAAVEFLLTKPFVTPVWELRNCTISLRDAYVDGSSAGLAAEALGRVPNVLRLEHLNGSLRHGRHRGGTRVSLRGRLYDGRKRASGILEWVGTREPKGAIRTTLATTGLELAILLPYARAMDPEASLEGALSGALAYETVVSDRSRVDVDFIVHDLKTSLVLIEASQLGELQTERADARFVVNVSPDSVEVLHARFASGALDLNAKGAIGRPLGEKAQEYGFRIGLALVLSLFVFVTWNDLVHLDVF